MTVRTNSIKGKDSHTWHCHPFNDVISYNCKRNITMDLSSFLLLSMLLNYIKYQKYEAAKCKIVSNQMYILKNHTEDFIWYLEICTWSGSESILFKLLLNDLDFSRPPAITSSCRNITWLLSPPPVLQRVLWNIPTTAIYVTFGIL